MGRASLKPAQSGPIRLLSGPISRPYGPGLIEARCRSHARIPADRISRPYGPGLIEACGCQLGSATTSTISRPYGPGLIEAMALPAVGMQLFVDFPALWAGPH